MSNAHTEFKALQGKFEALIREEWDNILKFQQHTEKEVKRFDPDHISLRTSDWNGEALSVTAEDYYGDDIHFTIPFSYFEDPEAWLADFDARKAEEERSKEAKRVKEMKDNLLRQREAIDAMLAEMNS